MDRAVNDYEHLRPQTTWKRTPYPPLDMNPHAIGFGFFEQPVRDPLRAMVSIDLFPVLGAGDWLHISVSRARRLPTWGDLCAARDQLGYRERLFVQLVPPASAWLNMHSHCLHLVSRLDAESVPPILWQAEGADGAHYGKRGSIV